MPANSTHPEYDSAWDDWRTVRDVMAGESAIKSGGERYLPRIQSHTDEEYDLYLERASFFNATARTAEGYLGLLFRRPPFIKLPDSTSNSPIPRLARDPAPALAPIQVPQPLRGEVASNPKSEVSSPSPGGLEELGKRRKEFTEGEGPLRAERAGASESLGRGEGGPSHPSATSFSAQVVPRTPYVSSVQKALLRFLSDADLLGNSFNAWAKKITNEVVTVGRCGSYIDWQNAGRRAYVARYPAESIINWRVERVYDRLVPTLIVLQESAPSALSEDRFVEKSVDQLRVHRLVPPDMLPHSITKEDLAQMRVDRSAWAHIVELWQPSPVKERYEQPKWQLIQTIIPKRFGKPLPLIPFVFHGPRHSQPEIDKSPLSDLIAVNLDHYRLDADYKHGLHYTALPTAWVSGFDRASNLKIGSSTAWVTETTGAAAGFLEFRGQGLTSFERAMDRDERLMAVLGSRLLEDQKKVGETAEAIELRQSGENSILGSIATSLSESLTQVLRWVYWWHSIEDTPDLITEDQALVRVNTDFSTKGIASTQLEAIVKAWQAGAISQNTMLELFRKGEILPDGRTNQEEISLLANGNGIHER